MSKKLYNLCNSTHYIDIDNNGTLDRITKTFVETGNAHSYYKYTIEIKEGDKFIDITPDNFQTTNGVICDLQQIQFRFEPQFMVKLIYRELGDLWDEPTIAKQKTFMLSGNSWQTYPEKKLKPICDVKELLLRLKHRRLSCSGYVVQFVLITILGLGISISCMHLELKHHVLVIFAIQTKVCQFLKRLLMRVLCVEGQFLQNLLVIVWILYGDEYRC